MPKVLVSKINNDVPQQIKRIFDEFVPGLKGKKVVIKPNILSPTPPEEGNTTHPDVVRAAVRECEARGALDIKVGDCPGSLEGNSRNTARLCGILDACEGHFYPLARRVTWTPVTNRWVDGFWFPDALLEADYVINLAHYKVTVQTTVTGAVKNCYGYLPGGLKPQNHFKAMGRRRFDDMLLALFSVRPPDLHIIEGIYMMDSLGPRGGRVRPWGGLLASPDPMAVDATAIRLMGADPASEYVLAMGAERGLGTWNQDEIEVVGQLDPIPDFRMPPKEGFFQTAAAGELLKQLGLLKPVVYKDKCKPCNECSYCPVGAITVQDYPVVDEEKCISCFVCAEFCPQEALQAPPGEGERLMVEIFR
ncbi:MAG: DUF362 domain-containing protein [Dehalococcoidia bacterium]|nr:DUF362 domain-containing protein [Dehalococcoidia bacterium]